MDDANVRTLLSEFDGRLESAELLADEESPSTDAAASARDAGNVP